MKAAKIIVPVGILAACIGASMLLVSSNRGQAEAGSSQPPPTVRVAAVQPIEWTVELDGRGSIEAEDEAVISAQVRGRVQAISRQLEIGVDVEAGEWLLTLDPTDFELEVQRREAAVASARLALERQELELDVAAAEWTAAEPPGSTVDDLVGEGPLALRRQEVAAARAELDAALADAAQARLDLDRCRITAPAAGRIHSRSVSVGEYVAPGQPLGQLWVLDQAEIRVPIPADEVAWLPPLDGAPPPLLVRSLGDRGVERWGRLVRREGEIDRRDRVLYVVAGLDDPFRDSSSERIEIGTFVEVWIPGRPLRAMPIPRASLRGSDRVLVVDEGRLYSRQVTIARMESGTAFVTDGL
ncbi:MAG: efflux RND transporter periplasmic adaptor subunit, partial [Acidobacteriota bacterium]